jgi:uncharacterized protein involved in cysteine biosynthesis
LCGYDRPETGSRLEEGAAVPGCPSCGLAPREPSLAANVPTWRGVRAGLAAVPRGLGFLMTTRGVKRWIVPPAILTFAAFGAATWWLYVLIDGWIERLKLAAQSPVSLDAPWIERALAWLFTNSVLIWIAELGGIFLVIAAAALAMLWTFSLVYEVISGPFLDEIHGRIEKRWFGIDPRNERERPSGIDAPEIARISRIAGAVSALLVIAAFLLEGGAACAVALAGPVLAFAVAGVARRDYGRWLAWRLRLELRTLAVSLEASALSGLMLLFAIPVLFVPLVGYPLFALAAGFTTAISLLDIPMSRRRWKLSLRIAFLFQHLPAVLAFGTVASLLYMIPIVGPLAMVPAASVGGLWLFCKLDKTALQHG